jgi:hypothetical protein
LGFRSVPPRADGEPPSSDEVRFAIHEHPGAARLLEPAGHALVRCRPLVPVMVARADQQARASLELSQILQDHQGLDVHLDERRDVEVIPTSTTRCLPVHTRLTRSHCLRCSADRRSGEFSWASEARLRPNTVQLVKTFWHPGIRHPPRLAEVESSKVRRRRANRRCRGAKLDLATTNLPLEDSSVGRNGRGSGLWQTRRPLRRGGP